MQVACLLRSLLSTLATSVLAFAAHAQAVPERVLIERVHILDGRGGPPVRGHVLVVGDRIARVLPDAAEAPQDGANRCFSLALSACCSQWHLS